MLDLCCGADTADAFAAQEARVFITYYRGACHYSETELQRAREAGVGGDVLYRAMQQQSEDEADIAAETPLRRVGRPEEAADAIVFLASVQARWLTGQLLYVAGGYRMHQ